MLKLMRKKKARNAIIFLVVMSLLAYLLVAFGQGSVVAPGDTIAKLGDVKIKVRDALIQRENLKSIFSQMDNTNLNQVLASSLVSDAILLNGAQDVGFQISSEELRDLVIRNRTTSDGTFVDDEIWSNVIKNRYLMQVESYENYLKDRALKTDKFRQIFYAGAYVSEAGIREKFVKDNQRVNLEMLVLNAFDVRAETRLDDDAKLEKFYQEHQEKFMTGDLRQIRFVSFTLKDYENKAELTQEEIQSYYNENSERYRKQEQVRANHVLIKTEGRSEEEALAEINKIRGEIEGGLDFAEAAKKYSEDVSNKERGGDLGLFGRGRMVPAFESIAFSLPVGDVSQAVKTQFGYHLIKVTDHQQESVQPLAAVSASIRANLMRNKTRDLAMGLAADFRASLGEGEDFAAVAQNMGYTVHQSSFFDNDNRSNLGEVLNNNFQVRRATFSMNELQEISVPVDGGVMVVVFQWIAETEPQILEFNDPTKPRIRTMAQNLAAETFAAELFEDLRQAASRSPEDSLKDLKGDRDYLKDNHFKESGWVTTDSIPWEIKREDFDFQRDIYGHEPGVFLAGLESSSPTRFILVRLIEKKEPDLSKLDGVRVQLVEELRQEKGNDLLSGYIFAQLKDLDPDDRVQNRILAAVQR